MDASVAALEAMAAGATDPRSKLSILGELGGVYVHAPRWGSRKNGQLYRGEYVQGGEHVQLEPEHLVLALTALARGLDAAAEVIRALGHATRPVSVPAWEIALGYASCLERYMLIRGEAAGPLSRALVPAVWHARVGEAVPLLGLVDLAFTFAEECEAGEDAGLASFLRGNALWRAVEGAGGEIVVEVDGRWKVAREGKPALSIPSSPAAAFERACKLAPDPLLGASARMALARCLDAAGRHAEAAAQCRRFLDDTPQSVLADDARQLLESITLPQIRTESPQIIRPGEGASLEARWRNVDVIEVRVVALPFEEEVTSARGLRDADFLPLSAGSSLDALSRRLDALPARHVVTFTGDGSADHRWQRQIVKLPPLPSGAWCVRVRGCGVERCELLFVSDLGLMRIMEPARTIHFAASHATGQAVAGANLHVREVLQKKGLLGRYRTVRLQQIATDGRGLAQEERATLEGVLWSFEDVVAFAGAECAVVAPESPGHSRGLSTERVAWCERAQPIWRPGQRASLLFLLRQRLPDGKWGHWPEESLRVELTAPDGVLIDLGEKRMDGSGALALDHELPLDAVPGTWSLVFTFGRQRFFAGRLQVEEYRKPETTVECSGPLQPVRLGEALRLTVKARSFAGENLAGAAAQWRATRHAEWLGGTRPHDAAAESPEPAGSGAVTLDEHGAAVFEIDTRAFATRASASRFRVSVDVQDAALRKASTEVQQVVARSAFTPELHSRRAFGIPGETLPFFVEARDVQGRRVAGRGLFEVQRILSGSGPSERVGPVLHSQPVLCTAGEPSLMQWKAADAGRYLVRVRLEDPLAGEVAVSERFWVHEAGLDTRAFELKGVALHIQSARVEAGTSIQALVSTEIPDADVFLLATPAHGPSRVLVARAGSHLLCVDIPVLAGDVPGLQLAAFSATASGFASATADIDVPPSGRTLTVGLSAMASEVRPGEEVLLEAEVRDAQGRPVAARVLVAVHDAALDELVRESRGEIVSFFHRRERPQGVRANSSRGARTTGVDRIRTPWSRVEPTHWTPGSENDPGRIARWRVWLEAEQEGAGGPERGRAAFEILFGRMPERSHGLKGLFEGMRGFASVGAEASGRVAAPAAAEELQDSLTHDAEDDAAAAWGVTIRKDFRDSAVFARELQCDANGRATCRFRMPEDLSEWKGRIVAWTAATDVGEHHFVMKTVLPVQARMVLPRTLVAGDRCDIRLLGTRTSGAASEASWTISASAGDGRVGAVTPAVVHLEPGNTAVATAPLETPVAGALLLKATLRGADAGSSDGVELPLAVQPDGTPVSDTRRFAVAAGGESTIVLSPPPRHQPGSRHVRVEVRSNMVLQLFDCLPWLVDDPWECTDHVVARFVPAVLVRSALEKAGLRFDDVVEAARSAPRPPHVAAPRVLDSRELSRVIERCRRQLRAAQNSDGGFGWWEDADSSLTMTVRVLDGLNRAAAAGVSGIDSMRRRAAGWLAERAKSERHLPLLASIAAVLAPNGQCSGEMLEHLVLRQADLPTLSLAELVSALAAAQQTAPATRAAAALVERGSTDAATGTFCFPVSEESWAWWNSRIETAAAALEALLDLRPEHQVVPMLAEWLLTNRRAQGWTNTRDTARAIQALVRLAERQGDLAAELDLELTIGGVASRWMLGGAQSAAPLVIEVPAEEGASIPVCITARGQGKAHVLATLRAVAVGDDIRAGAHGLGITRRWYRVAADGRTLAELDAGESVEAGTRLRTILDIEAAMDAEYVFVADPRAAGFEPVLKASGWTTQNGLRIRREVRDDRTAFFIEHLQQGRHVITQDVHVETTGSVKALPARIEALYAPEFSGHSTARRFDVRLPTLRNQ